MTTTVKKAEIFRRNWVSVKSSEFKAIPTPYLKTNAAASTAKQQHCKVRYVLICCGSTLHVWNIGRAFASGGDILRSSSLEYILGAAHFIGIVTVNREKHTPLFEPTFVALGFIFRNSHSNQSAGDATKSNSNSDTSQSCHDRAGGDKGPKTRYCECTNPREPTQSSANSRSGAGTSCRAFRRLC